MTTSQSQLALPLAALFVAFLGALIARPLLSCVPSMTIDLGVKVLSEADRSDWSEPQGADHEGRAKSSGERDPRDDEQKPDKRRGQSGRVGT